MNSIHKDTAQPVQPKVRFIETPKGPIEFAEFGHGPVVVCIHGAMGGYDQGTILARTVLRGSYRVIAISRPGYLGTPIDSGETPESQADLLAALLDALGVTKVSAIAISGGGPAAIHFALRHPARCSALVLISTVSRPNTFKVPFRFQAVKLIARLPFVAAHMRDSAAANLEKIAQRSVSNPAHLRQLLADEESKTLFRDFTLSTFDRMSKRIVGSENDFRITQTSEYPLEKLSIPTLIIHGSRDPFANFEEHAQNAVDRIPCAELLVLEEGEHVAIFTHRGLVQRCLAKFLEDTAL